MTPNKQSRAEYRYPLGPYIDRGPRYQKLYKLEERRQDAIKAAAEELQKCLDLQDYWREALPEELLNILESYDRKAAWLAARAYVDKHPEIAAEFPTIERSNSCDK